MYLAAAIPAQEHGINEQKDVNANQINRKSLTEQMVLALIRIHVNHFAGKIAET